MGLDTKKWVWRALAAQFFLLIAFVAALFLSPLAVLYRMMEGVESVYPDFGPTLVFEQSATEDTHIMTEDEWQAFEKRWAQAPDNIQELARQIVSGETPSEATLKAIDPEALSKGYPAPELDFTRDGIPLPWASTLLKEAVWAYNLDATQALLGAGADPNVNNGEVLFIAVKQKTREAPHIMAFPDHDEMLPFLRAYLEAGADPNVQRFGFNYRTPITYNRDNLGAILLLLEYGADPWLKLPFPDIYQANGYLADSLMERRAFASANNVSSEILFRMARSGDLPRGPQDQEDQVFKELSEVVDAFATGTGSDARHKAWRLDQVLQVLGPALEQEERAENIRRKLASFDYEADGGWYLAEDEVHSRYDAPLPIPDKGTEIWGP